MREEVVGLAIVAALPPGTGMAPASCWTRLLPTSAACAEGMKNTLSEMCVTAERFLAPARYLTAERTAAERFLAPERYLTAERTAERTA